MSQNPGSPPPYYPQQQGYNREPRRVQQPAPRQGRAGFGFAMFFLGIVFSVIVGAVAVYFLYFFNANPTAPLPRPTNQTGTSDLAATLSQTYLNREITAALSGKPIQSNGVTIRDIVIEVKADSQMDVTMRTSAGPATFDLLVTESLSVENGKVKIGIVGQPKVSGGVLPPSVGQILDQVNTQFIEPQINSQVAALDINGSKLQLTGINSQPGAYHDKRQHFLIFYLQD